MDPTFRQADCFELADKHGYSVIFKIFPPPNFKDRFSTCKSNRTLAKLIKKSTFELQTHQELLRDGKCWILPYWDLDMYTVEVDNIAETRRQIITAFNCVCTTVFPYINEKFNPAYCKWSDSSGVVGDKYKISLHCVYRDISIGFEFNRANQEGREKRRAMHQFGKLCILESKKYPILEDIIDSKVWTTNRAMRCVGAHKANSQRVLKPLTPEFETDDEFTRTDIESHLISRFERPERPCRIKDSVDLHLVAKPVMDTKFLDEMAAGIGCCVDTINGNLITLKTVDVGRICPLTGLRYVPGDNRCFFHIQNGDVYYRQHGVDGTKLIAARKDSTKRYELYDDIQKLISLYKRAGDEFTLNMVKDYIRDTVIYINKPCKPEFIVKVDGFDYGFSLSEVDSFKYVQGQDLYGPISRCAKFRCRVVLKNKKGEDYVEMQEFKIKNVLDDMVASMTQLRTFTDCRYVPFSIDQPYIGKCVFNCFIPFSFLNRKPTRDIPFHTHAIYELMRSDLTGCHKEAFEYLLNYVAMKMQYPARKIDTALAFVRTIQGVGKSQWAKWIRILFDDRNCKVVANLDNLFGSFNAHLRHCLWLFLEEVKGKGASWSEASRLKDLISSESQLWTKKHHETEEGGWFGSIVIFSNNSFGIRVETSDRRYCLFDSKEKYRDDIKFHNLVEAQTMDVEYMSNAFWFFMNRDISQWNWKKIPKTQTRTAVKRACESVGMTFTRWLFENKSNHSNEWTNSGPVLTKLTGGDKDWSYVTNTKQLVEAFRRFRDETGHSTKLNDRNTIMDTIKQLWRKNLSPGQFRIDGARKRGFKIKSIRALQRDLEKIYRDPIDLELLNVTS